MSKLSFRARALDVSKPMPIFMAEELPDLPDYSAINRAVPQMPSGMKKEEECEHHLQRAICAGLIIPTPEVSDIPDNECYDKLYPANYKQPKQLIHMQPFAMEPDIPDYDMDSEDERWLMSQARKLDLTPLKFEEMMDRLEKSSGQTVVTLNEAKALLKEDDDLIIAVFDYWLNKRLKTQHPLILSVKTEHRAGISINNPYLAFRRRTEKMQTRKNRKNDETSYEKMLKLKRDLCRAVTLLELVKRREKMKREFLHLTVEVFEKRYQARDFSGAIVNEVNTLKASRPAFTPIFHNQYTNQGWSNKAILKDEVIPRKEKRQYKKRKHKWIRARMDSVGTFSSDEEPAAPLVSPEPEEVEDEGLFAFRRNKLCSYHMPVQSEGNWPWCSKEENGLADKRFRYTLTSLSNPRRCVGFARRRIGRGGRVILDRASTDSDDLWRTLDFTIYEPNKTEVKTESRTEEVDGGLRTSFSGGSVNECAVKTEAGEGAPTKEEQDEMVEFLKTVRRDWLHFRPKTPPPDYSPPCHLLPAEDSVFVPSANTPFSLELEALDGSSGTLLDTSTFVTSPFLLDELEVPEVVPVTDTRQQPGDLTTAINLNVNVGLDTLNNDSFVTSSNVGERTVGCSKFRVYEGGARDGDRRQQTVISSTLSSCKFNYCSEVCGEEKQNGLILDGCKTKSNKIPYAYTGGVGFSNAPTSTLSLHTSAHALTLNSHSANIVEIPMSNDTDKKVVNSQRTEAGNSPPNNKNKTTIVQKNNLVMEVT